MSHVFKTRKLDLSAE